MSKLSSRLCSLPLNLLSFYLLMLTNVSAQGLSGTYYGTRTLEGAPILTRIDPMVDFQWMNTSPDPAIGNDNFSVRWQGTITVNTTGNYQLGLISDDGCRVWIDDRLLVDAWKDTGPTLFVNQTRLVAGRSTPIMIEYYEASGGATASLMIAPDGQAPGLVPSDWLSPNFVEHQGLPKVGVFSNDLRATEGRDRLTFTVYRIGGLGTALPVRISLGDQVVSGVDYVPFNTEITIPAHASAVSVNVSPINNDTYQGTRNLNLTVVQSDTYTRQTDQPLILQIVDDEREIQEGYTIAGEITSDKNLTGHVILEVTPVLNDMVDQSQVKRFTFIEAGFFSTSRLTPNTYELWAFLDQNENGIREMDEPQGFWPDGSVRWRVDLPPDQYQANLRFKLLLDMAIIDQNLSDASLTDQGEMTDVGTQDQEIPVNTDQQIEQKQDQNLSLIDQGTFIDQGTLVDDMTTQQNPEMGAQDASIMINPTKNDQSSGCMSMDKILHLDRFLSILLVYCTLMMIRKRSTRLI